ncbi:MAG: type II toxin-antitoxin system RelE/ParE family toxin [Deltaproteobacteria bacterium]|nr:type II toxin-antitoxin system RelE/ParE family toxin [Deltaproteobacteria bacterium]
MMQFTVEFYETPSGQCPMRDFLDNLKESDPDDFAAVVAGLAKLRNRQYHRPPLSKSIGDDLFELRHVGKLNTRVLYSFMKGCRIIAVHGIRHKGREIPTRDRNTALERKNDWLIRHNQ